MSRIKVRHQHKGHTGTGRHAAEEMLERLEAAG